MYTINRFIDSVDFPSDFVDDNSQWHPLSYYVNGGIDLENATALNASVEYDGDIESTPDVYKSPDVGQPFYDPRISGFDIAEKLGVETYKAAMDESIASRPEPSSESSIES